MPYSVAAAGPFTISIDSMSSGLMSLIREGAAPRPCPKPPISRLLEVCPLSIRMPSM